MPGATQGLALFSFFIAASIQILKISFFYFSLFSMCYNSSFQIPEHVIMNRYQGGGAVKGNIMTAVDGVKNFRCVKLE